MSIALALDPFGPPILAGRMRAWMAAGADLESVLTLRARAFRSGAADGDPFDQSWIHLCSGPVGEAPVATVRAAVHADGASLLCGYAAAAYDLRAMAADGGVSVELGRLCTATGGQAAQQQAGAGQGADTGPALRLLWGAVARLVLNSGAERLIGCTSFRTDDPARIAPALAYLHAHHLGPARLRPGVQAPDTVPLSAFAGAQGAIDLPPLWRFYLMMGAWVSDHVVIDRDLGTCHLFTCVEVSAMPDHRRRALLRLAATSAGDAAAGAECMHPLASGAHSE